MRAGPIDVLLMWLWLYVCVNGVRLKCKSPSGSSLAAGCPPDSFDLSFTIPPGPAAEKRPHSMKLKRNEHETKLNRK